MNKPINPTTLFADDETSVSRTETGKGPASNGPELIDTFSPQVEAALVRIEAKIGASHPEQFDWTNDESVVLRPQPAVALYFNKEGALVIRQEREWDQDEDTFIFVAAVNTQHFLDRLCDVLGIGSAP